MYKNKIRTIESTLLTAPYIKNIIIYYIKNKYYIKCY